MSEDADDSEKTEEPTGRKLAKAREKGNVPRSQEVSHWFMILSLLLIISFFAQSMLSGIGGIIVQFLAQPHTMSIDHGHLGDSILQTARELLKPLLMPATIIIAAALTASIIQNGIVISTDKMKPKLSNIGLKKGFNKMFSWTSVMELAKSLVKLAIVTTVVVVIVWPEQEVLMNIPMMSMIAFLQLVQSVAVKVVLGILVVLTIIMVADVAYTRYDHNKQLKMTKSEVKDEAKQADGDPIVKGRLRQIRMERARQRMMAAVPEADVVITNPTHFAVALRYDQVNMEAPRLTAKGMDEVALRIRQVAKEHDVPVVENPPLARALYSGVELDQEVPPEHYKLVAEVIGYVMRLKGKL